MCVFGLGGVKPHWIVAEDRALVLLEVSPVQRLTRAKRRARSGKLLLPKRRKNGLFVLSSGVPGPSRVLLWMVPGGFSQSQQMFPVLDFCVLECVRCALTCFTSHFLLWALPARCASRASSAAGICANVPD